MARSSARFTWAKSWQTPDPAASTSGDVVCTPVLPLR